MNREELVEAFWNGEVGEVEFAELALALGISLAEIGQVIAAVRAEDDVDAF